MASLFGPVSCGSPCLDLSDSIVQYFLQNNFSKTFLIILTFFVCINIYVCIQQHSISVSIPNNNFFPISARYMEKSFYFCYLFMSQGAKVLFFLNDVSGQRAEDCYCILFHDGYFKTHKT